MDMDTINFIRKLDLAIISITPTNMVSIKNRATLDEYYANTRGQAPSEAL